MGYQLGEPRKIIIVDQGETLGHYLKDLASEDWLGYQRTIAAFDGTDEGDRVRRQILTAYDTRAVKVEGYVYAPTGEDLMTARPDDWKDYIPGNHKWAAMIELINGGQLKKN